MLTVLKLHALWVGWDKAERNWMSNRQALLGGFVNRCGFRTRTVGSELCILRLVSGGFVGRGKLVVKK